jgi:glyoxylase-like metal-dependent hydrolase (beta-lactamase superfamily II)
MVRVVGRLIDLLHLGRDRVIGAWLVGGVIVDPGPESCVGRLLAGLDGEEPRALLLTHIHLDHAGASGALVRRFPRLPVYVHERGARHLVEPSKLLASARQLYGDDMDRLWGEVAPVPGENVRALSGGETVEGFQVAYTPGHASHHVCYLDDAGHAYVGDVAGVRIPPSEHVVAPTPPPDIDLEAWERSLATVERWSPAALRLTHFGQVDAVDEHLARMREQLHREAEWARDRDEPDFARALGAELPEDVGPQFIQAAPPDQLYLGLERYWHKKAETQAA